MTFLDSDIFVDMLRGFTPSLAWYAGLVTKPSVPGVVAMELVQGIRRDAQVARGAQTFEIVTLCAGSL